MTQNVNRIAHLEETIEKLGKIFVELADDLLGSSLPSFDRQLICKLHGSMQDALSLIKGNADPPEQPHRHDLVAENSSTSLHTSEITRHLKNGDPLPTQSDLLGGLKSSYEPRTRSSPDDMPSLEVNASGNASRSDSHHGAGGISREPSLYTANIFGNGWMDQVPAALGALSFNGNMNQLQEGSLALNIVSSTLYYAYHALWESYDASNLIFRYAIKMHSREELLFNLRWFLGPGYNEMYRLAGATFKSVLHNWPSNVPSLHPILNSEAMSNNDATFINADDVATYLGSKSPRYVGGDVLELIIDDADTGRLEPGLSKPYSEGQPTFLNMDLFFPSAAGWQPADSGISKATRKRNILVLQSALFKNLSNISLCLSYGPGFRKQNLDGAILASEIH
jgi:hypothetical protein